MSRKQPKPPSLDIHARSPLYMAAWQDEPGHAALPPCIAGCLLSLPWPSLSLSPSRCCGHQCHHHRVVHRRRGRCNKQHPPHPIALPPCNPTAASLLSIRHKYPANGATGIAQHAAALQEALPHTQHTAALPAPPGLWTRSRDPPPSRAITAGQACPHARTSVL